MCSSDLSAGTTSLTVNLSSGYRGWVGVLIWVWSVSEEESTAQDINSWNSWGAIGVSSLANMRTGGGVLQNPPERAAILKGDKGTTESQEGPARMICEVTEAAGPLYGMYVEPPYSVVGGTAIGGATAEVDYWAMGVMVLEGVSIRLNPDTAFAVGEWSFLTDEPVADATHRGMVRELQRLVDRRVPTWAIHGGQFQVVQWYWWPLFSPYLTTEIGTSYVEVAGCIITEQVPVSDRTGFNLIVSLFCNSNVQTGSDISTAASYTFKVEAIQLADTTPAKDVSTETAVSIIRNNGFDSLNWTPCAQNVWGSARNDDWQLRGHLIEPRHAGLTGQSTTPDGDLYRLQHVELEFDDIDLSNVSYPFGLRVSMKNAVAASTEFNDITIVGFGAASKPLPEVHWHVQTLTHADFTAAAQNETVALTGFPAGVDVTSGRITLNTEMSGGGVSSCVAEVGDAADIKGLMEGTDVFTGAGTGHKEMDGTEAGRHTEAAFTPTLTLTVDAGHNVAGLTAGSIDVIITWMDS